MSGKFIAVTRALLKGFRFLYNKKSCDGTTKANIANADGGEVWGVCLEIDYDEIENLKKIEKGYDHRTVWIRTTVGNQEFSSVAQTFISNHNNAGESSPDYVEKILRGAAEFNLPETYINTVLKVEGKLHE